MKASSALVILAAAVVITSSGRGTGAQGLAVGRPEWSAASRHDTSRPLREMPPRPAISTREDFEVKHETPKPAGGSS
jgi:hypothetical protein